MNILTFIKDFRSAILVGGGVAILILAIFLGQNVRAADTAAVSATVTATNLAVSVSDGSIAFGSGAPHTTNTTARGAGPTHTRSK